MDAVFVIMLETPVGDIEKLEERLAVAEAQLDPKAARERWGNTPETQAMGGRLMEG